MDLPAVQLLSLEQGQQTLETHTSGFLDLACLTTFPAHSPCAFFLSSLNRETKEPQGNFAEFIEWVLVNCDSPYTVSPTLTPATPETSHLPPVNNPRTSSSARDKAGPHQGKAGPHQGNKADLIKCSSTTDGKTRYSPFI